MPEDEHIHWLFILEHFQEQKEKLFIIILRNNYVQRLS